MAGQVPPRPRQPDPPDDGRGRNPRLGIDLPTGWWPTPARLKAIEAAGFHLLQVRMPRSVLREEPLLVAHAGAVRDSLRLTGLRLVLDAPDDLVAGTTENDALIDAALRYAARAGSELLVYRRLRVPRPRRDLGFGARWDVPRPGGIEPLRLDLHLPPGAGSVPWRALAPLLAGHEAPIVLEIHPDKRPELPTLAVLMRELLGVDAGALSAR